MPQYSSATDPIPYRLVSAATLNQTLVKASAGKLIGAQVSNINAAARYIHLFDKATAPQVGVDTPMKTLLLPAAAQSFISFGGGVGFNSGLGFALSTVLANAAIVSTVSVATGATCTVTVTAAGGTFTVTVDGVATAAQAYNVTGANLQTALNTALTGGGKTAAVSGDGPYAVTITGTGAAATTWTVNGSALTTNGAVASGEHVVNVDYV
jgi:hypothetical protein